MNALIRFSFAALIVLAVFALTSYSAHAQSRRQTQTYAPPSDTTSRPQPSRRTSFISSSAREERVARLCRDASGRRVYNETRKDHGRTVYCPGRTGKR